MTIKRKTYTAFPTLLTTIWGLSKENTQIHTRQKSLTRKSLGTCYKVRRNLMSPLISDFFTRLIKKNVKVDIDEYCRQNALIIQPILTCSLYDASFLSTWKNIKLFYNLLGSRNELVTFYINGCWSIRRVAHILRWVHRMHVSRVNLVKF